MSDNNKHEMSDKEFYLKLSLSLISIIGCVGMMISSALAIFVSEATSTGNIIRAGEFNVVATSFCGCSGDGVTFTACVADKDEHTFTIEPDGTVDGYAKIIIDGNGERVEQYTEQLHSPITVKIAAMPGTTIRFKSYWGKVEKVEPVSTLLARDGTFIYHSLTPVPEEEEISDDETVTEGTEETQNTETQSGNVETDDLAGTENDSTESESEPDEISEPDTDVVESSSEEPVSSDEIQSSEDTVTEE